MSNGINTVAESSNSESKMGFSTTHQSSVLTSENLTDESLKSIEAWLTSYQVDFHVNHFQLPERDEAIRMNATCGLPQSSAFAWYDPDTSCWRTFQVSLLTNMCDEFTETWPKAGIIRNGVAYRRLKWERIISAIDGGLLLPTPQSSKPDGRKPKADWIWNKTHWITGDGKKVQTDLQKFVKMWPTPKAQNANAPGIHGQGGLDLQTKVAIVESAFPTPQSRDWKGKSQRGNHGNTKDCLPNAVGGNLNPTWVDWLMGVPHGWTDLNHSVTPKCLSVWLQPMHYCLKMIIKSRRI